MDTPGFNDTHKSEVEVLQDLASWLKSTYESNIRLNGIVYLHPIASPRIESSVIRNFKMFRQLCGKEALNSVVLATTFWSSLAEADGLSREQELRTRPELWGAMLSHGSIMKRLIDQQNALDIVGMLIGKPRVTLQIQHELVEDNKLLVDTAAGKVMNEELLRVMHYSQEQLDSVKQHLHEAVKEHDYTLQPLLAGEQQRIQRELNTVRQQQNQLRGVLPIERFGIWLEDRRELNLAPLVRAGKKWYFDLLDGFSEVGLGRRRLPPGHTRVEWTNAGHS